MCRSVARIRPVPKRLHAARNGDRRAGAELMQTCRHCGFESPLGLRFCGSCGAQLPDEAVQRQTRKVVTALFCDVTGSTALGEELDPEILRGVINGYFAVIRTTIERHGGTVEKFIGDAVMAVFGIPVVREDDALRAVRAAAEIRQRLPGCRGGGGGRTAVPHRCQHGYGADERGRELRDRGCGERGCAARAGSGARGDRDRF